MTKFDDLPPLGRNVREFSVVIDRDLTATPEQQRAEVERLVRQRYGNGLVEVRHEDSYIY